jgi:small-conductance mechanosensitive channel
MGPDDLAGSHKFRLCNQAGAGTMTAMDLSGALVDFLAWWRWLLNYPLLELGDRALTPGLLLLLVTLLLLVWLVEIPLRRFVLRRVLGRTRLEPAMQYAVARLAGYLFILLGWFVALQTLGINLSSLALFAGALGVGLGFGLQNIVSNFISGIILLAERPVAVGDRVEVGSVAGRITQINLRSTMVITNDNISIIVPNSEFVSSQVVNWSHGDPKVRMRLPVGIAYGSDVEKFRRAMLEVARAHPAVLPQPEPFVYFIGFGDSSLDFEVSVWTIDLASSPRRLRSDLYYAIESKLREIGVEIPFPQRDLHLRTVSPQAAGWDGRTAPRDAPAD